MKSRFHCVIHSLSVNHDVYTQRRNTAMKLLNSSFYWNKLYINGTALTTMNYKDWRIIRNWEHALVIEYKGWYINRSLNFTRSQLKGSVQILYKFHFYETGKNAFKDFTNKMWNNSFVCTWTQMVTKETFKNIQYATMLCTHFLGRNLYMQIICKCYSCTVFALTDVCATMKYHTAKTKMAIQGHSRSRVLESVERR